jgi:hypothetical protein
MIFILKSEDNKERIDDRTSLLAKANPKIAITQMAVAISLLLKMPILIISSHPIQKITTIQLTAFPSGSFIFGFLLFAH